MSDQGTEREEDERSAIRRWSGPATTVLQYAIGLAALMWVFSGVDWNRFVQLLGRLDPFVISAIILVTIVGLFGRFYTWQVLLKQIGTVSLVEAGWIDLAINFINQLFPSRLSGRSVAPVIVRQRTGIDWADAIAVTGVHTAVYAVLYGVIALIGIALAWWQLEFGILLLVGLSALLYLVAGVGILMAGRNMNAINRLTHLLRWLGTRLPVGGRLLESVAESAPGFADNSATQFRALSTNTRVMLAYTVGWTGVMLLAPGIRVGLLFAEIGDGFTPVILVPVYLVMAYSVTLLPLTPGGIGISEATATLVFVTLGVPQSVVAPVIFFDRLVSVYLPALIGGIPAMRLDLSGLIR